jgi:uncharacterized protein (DUF433 family)
MTVPEELQNVLRIDPEIMHGKLCFTGTRVPLTVFLDNMEEGMGINEFIHEYPSVTREQASAIVTWEQRNLKQSIGIESISAR